MTEARDVVDSYVAVWNEGDAAQRRRRIRALWALEGTTCYRMLDAQGYEAIEARVAGSWAKWLGEGKYLFRPKAAACHHDVVKFDWVMVTVPGGAVEATGLSFLILTSSGRILHDYQFNPNSNEPNEHAERYVAMMNESDASVRRRSIAELWAPDGAFVSATSLKRGHGAIEAEVSAAHDAHVAKGMAFALANRTHAHHNLVTFQWQWVGEGGTPATGADLLVLDEGGRIRFDYRFDEPIADDDRIGAGPARVASASGIQNRG
jgi:hypothetical protein